MQSENMDEWNEKKTKTKLCRSFVQATLNLQKNSQTRLNAPLQCPSADQNTAFREIMASQDYLMIIVRTVQYSACIEQNAWMWRAAKKKKKPFQPVWWTSASFNLPPSAQQVIENTYRRGAGNRSDALEKVSPHVLQASPLSPLCGLAHTNGNICPAHVARAAFCCCCCWLLTALNLSRGLQDSSAERSSVRQQGLTLSGDQPWHTGQLSKV